MSEENREPIADIPEPVGSTVPPSFYIPKTYAQNSLRRLRRRLV
jgi:hypothetical protein